MLRHDGTADGISECFSNPSTPSRSVRLLSGVARRRGQHARGARSRAISTVRIASGRNADRVIVDLDTAHCAHRRSIRHSYGRIRELHYRQMRIVVMRHVERPSVWPREPHVGHLLASPTPSNRRAHVSVGHSARNARSQRLPPRSVSVACVSRRPVRRPRRWRGWACGSGEPVQNRLRGTTLQSRATARLTRLLAVAGCGALFVPHDQTPGRSRLPRERPPG